LLLGWYVYRGYQLGQADPLEAPLGPLYTLLRNKYYFDELYDFLFVRPVYWVSETFVSVWVDKGVIDGTLHLIGRAALRLGEICRNELDVPVINGFGDLVDAEGEPALELASRLVSGRALDAGPLTSARALEGMTAVILNVNKRYKAHAGIRLTGLP